MEGNVGRGVSLEKKRLKGYDSCFQHLNNCCVEELYCFTWPQREELSLVSGDYSNKFQLQRRKEFCHVVQYIYYNY